MFKLNTVILLLHAFKASHMLEKTWTSPVVTYLTDSTFVFTTSHYKSKKK